MTLKRPTNFYFLALLTTAIAGATPPFGTWKVNVERSQFEPGPAPFKSFTLSFVPAENGAYRITAKGETKDGAPVRTTSLLPPHERPLCLLELTLNFACPADFVRH